MVDEFQIKCYVHRKLLFIIWVTLSPSEDELDVTFDLIEDGFDEEGLSETFGKLILSFRLGMCCFTTERFASIYKEITQKSKIEWNRLRKVILEVDTLVSVKTEILIQKIQDILTSIPIWVPNSLFIS